MSDSGPTWPGLDTQSVLPDLEYRHSGIRRRRISGIQIRFRDLDTGSHPPLTDSSGMTILPLSVFFQSYATSVLLLVAVTPQALPTGERPSNQGFRLDEKKGSLVPRCSGLAYRSD